MVTKQKEDLISGGLHNTMATSTRARVKGDITTEVDFRLDGEIEGNVTCKGGKLVLGPKGHVKGNIVATNAEIMGTTDGSITIEAKLIIKSTAIIKGDIQAQCIEIEPNARFNGTCTMINKKND